MMIYCDNGHADFLLPFAVLPAFRIERLRAGRVALPDGQKPRTLLLFTTQVNICSLE